MTTRQKVAKALNKIAKSLKADDAFKEIQDWCDKVNDEAEGLKSNAFCPELWFDERRKTVNFEMHISYSKGVWNRDMTQREVSGNGLEKMLKFLDKKAEECGKLFPDVKINW